MNPTQPKSLCKSLLIYFGFPFGWLAPEVSKRGAGWAKRELTHVFELSKQGQVECYCLAHGQAEVENGLWMIIKEIFDWDNYKNVHLSTL